MCAARRMAGWPFWTAFSRSPPTVRGAPARPSMWSAAGMDQFRPPAFPGEVPPRCRSGCGIHPAPAERPAISAVSVKVGNRRESHAVLGDARFGEPSGKQVTEAP